MAGDTSSTLPMVQMLPPQQQTYIGSSRGLPQEQQLQESPHQDAAYSSPPGHIVGPVYAESRGSHPQIGSHSSVQRDDTWRTAAAGNAPDIKGVGSDKEAAMIEDIAGGDVVADILLRWSLQTDGPSPQYTGAMKRLGLSRLQFEEDCARIHALYLAGSSNKHLFGCIPCSARHDDDKQTIDHTLPVINQRMQRAGIPMAYLYKIHKNTESVVHELTLQNVAL